MQKTSKKKKTPVAKHNPPDNSIQNKPAKSSVNIPSRYIAATTLLILTIIYYWQLLSGSGFLWNDYIQQNFPYRLFASTALREGVFPFWNPYVFSGMPFFADIQTAVLYPLNLILVPFASETWLDSSVFQIQLVFHIFLSGLFMYLLAKDLKLLTSSSLLAAIVYMFSAYMTAHIFHTNIIHAATWFPLIILFFRRMLEYKSILYLALCSLTLSVSFYAGHPQLMVHIYYWLGSFYLFSFIYDTVKKKTTFKQEAIRGGLFTGMVVLSIGLSSLQLLPTSALSEETSRQTMTLEEASEGSFRPYRFLTLLAPDFYGDPDSYWGISQRDTRGGTHNYWETAAYVGILPLLLSIFGAAIFIKKPIVLFLVIIGVVSILLAMGDSFFLFGIVFRLLPGLDRFRVPARFAYIFITSVSILSAYGLQWLLTTSKNLKPSTQKNLKLALISGVSVSVLLVLLLSSGAFKQTINSFILNAGVFGSDQASISAFVDQEAYPAAVNASVKALLFILLSAALIFLNFKGILTTKMTATCALIIVFADLGSFGMGYASRGSDDPSRVFSHTDLVKQLQEQQEKEFFRINSRGTNPGSYEIGGPFMFLHRNQGSVHRLFLMEGYNQLRLNRQIVDRRPRSLDLMNVKYKIHVNNSNQMSIVTHPSYQPRAWMAYSYEIETDESKILSRIHSADFDHRNSVILEEKPIISPSQEGNYTVEITSYSLNEITLEVETEKDGFLILSEIYYPAWKAYVNGEEKPLYRAQYALRAIPVSAGKHTVVCRFEDESFKAGLVGTLFSLLITAGIISYSIVKRRQQTKK
ncbi:YfhO family protein [Chitinispirillales bacterium ANBcel5]|uniref:YfhO family protein n=1 Tax=Cellulosispirillum alkaliphilum TaxID=3039283 RepID=UPI002A573ACE|nr:YfhO family protein [Chitinispirillales bacterium ANBcel5]